MARALGRYELLRPLARGGMAEVFVARRRAAGVEKLLVIKRIRPERAADAAFLELFVKEARLSMSLAHQNIVPVFDFGRVDDQVYIAMERVEGKDLGSSLARAGDHRLPPLLAAFVAAECCQALDYAHRRARDGEPLGIVHRDVTPRNVLLSWSGEVKLTDFGIAALAGDQRARLLGTPAYMAPEQARREPVDARADLYAVGLLLREALTGAHARRGADRDAVLAAARTGELAPWPDDAPPGLVAIADRATAPARDDRYPDARAMLAALDAYIVTERAAARGDPPARQLAAWLAATWDGARDDAGDEALPDAAFVSFFDDAAGTETQRSLVATVVDEAATAAEPEPAPAPAPGAAPPAVAQRPPPPASGRRLAIAGIAVAVAAVGYAWTRGDRAAPATATVAAAVEPPPPAPAPATTDAAIAEADPPPPSPPSPALPAAPPTAGSATGSAAEPPRAVAAGPRERPRPRPRPDADADAAPTPPPRPRPAPDRGSAAPAVVAATVRVTLNALPWAYVTVDDDPTRHETIASLRLAPGPHRFRFSNPQLKVTREITLDIPADRPEFHHVVDLR